MHPAAHKRRSNLGAGLVEMAILLSLIAAVAIFAAKIVGEKARIKMCQSAQVVGGGDTGQSGGKNGELLGQDDPCAVPGTVSDQGD